ncbi:MAG: hypothetical protein GXP47_06670 [Acidobacteria bacterium]|nr:hypothetical protein [Acidobacteriota bacterium]
MGTPKPGGSKTPLVSPPRFRRLLRIGEESEDLEQLFQQIGRVIALLGHTVNVTDLAKNLYKWDAGIRKQWALDYYEQLDKKKLKGK